MEGWHVDWQGSLLVFKILLLYRLRQLSTVVLIGKHDRLLVFELPQLRPKVLRVELSMVQLEPLQLKFSALDRLGRLRRFLDIISVDFPLGNG